MKNPCLTRLNRRLKKNLKYRRQSPKQMRKKSQVDVQTQIQIAMLQQKMHRQRLAMRRNKRLRRSLSRIVRRHRLLTHCHNPRYPTTAQPVEHPTLPQVEDSLAKLNSKITQRSRPHLQWIYFGGSCRERADEELTTEPCATCV